MKIPKVNEYFVGLIIGISANLIYGIIYNYQFIGFTIISISFVIIGIIIVSILSKTMSKIKLIFLLTLIIISAFIGINGYNVYSKYIHRFISYYPLYDNSKLEIQYSSYSNNDLTFKYKIHEFHEFKNQQLYLCISYIQTENQLTRTLYCYKSIEINNAQGSIKYHFPFEVDKDNLGIVLLNQPINNRFIRLTTTRFALYKKCFNYNLK